MQQYKLYLNNDHKQEVTCSAAQSQCSVEVPPQVHALSISVLTLYGTSPPADVPLTQSGTDMFPPMTEDSDRCCSEPSVCRRSGTRGPALRRCAPVMNDSAALVSWLRQREELLYYVIEWTSGRAAGLQWRKLTRDQNSTVITGTGQRPVTVTEQQGHLVTAL